MLFGWKEDGEGKQQLIIKRVLHKDVWLMASMNYDDTQLEVLLSSVRWMRMAPIRRTEF